MNQLPYLDVNAQPNQGREWSIKSAIPVNSTGSYNINLVL